MRHSFAVDNIGKPLLTERTTGDSCSILHANKEVLFMSCDVLTRAYKVQDGMAGMSEGGSCANNIFRIRN